MAVQSTLIKLNAQNPQEVKAVLDKIMSMTGQKWRDCKRKAYNIHACKLPSNYVYANKLEQPESYKAIMHNYKAPIIPMGKIAQNQQAMSFLQAKGCYTTSDAKITLCGTQGEMWEVKLEKLCSSYTLADGSGIDPTRIPMGKWFTIARAAGGANEIGLCIPNNFVIQINMGWGIVTMNDPNSSGHFKGDVIVFPKAPDGSPDFTQSCSAINNAVFALTFDQTIGGWGRSGVIVPVEKAQATSPTAETLAKTLVRVQGGVGVTATKPLPDEFKAGLENWRTCTVIDMSDIEDALTDTNLQTYKNAVVNYYKEEQQLPAELSSIKSNCFRDFFGDVIASIKNNTFEERWRVSGLGNMISYAFCHTLVKYMSTKECVSLFRTTHNLGLFEAGEAVMVLQANTGYPSSCRVQRTENKFYFIKDIQNIQAAGCSVGNRVSGFMAVALIFDLDKSGICLSCVPERNSSTASMVEFDKFAVPVKPTGDTITAVLNSLAEAVMRSKIWGKYIKPSTNVKDCVYRSLANDIGNYYMHLLTTESYEALINATEKWELNGLSVPIVFNVVDKANVGSGSSSELETAATGNDLTDRRVLYVKFNQEDSTISFKVQFENKLFDKKYKLTKKNGITVIVLRAYMNMCSVLKVHPAKSFFANAHVWGRFLLPQASMNLARLMPNAPVLKYRGIKVKDNYIYVNTAICTGDGKTELGTRVLRVELNFKHFSMDNESNARVAAELDAMDSSAILEIMSIKLAIQNMKGAENMDFLRVMDVSNALAQMLCPLITELVTNTKKYASALTK